MFKRIILYLASIGTIIVANETLQVIRSEMNLEMERFAFDTTITLLEKETKFDNIGAQLEQSMNSKYGTGWMTLIGRDVSMVRVSRPIVESTQLLMRYQAEVLLLFQEKVTQTNCTKCEQKSIHQIIQDAQKANIRIYPGCYMSDDPAKNEELARVTKQVLASNDFSKCTDNPDELNQLHWCYQNVASKLAETLHNQKSLKTDNFAVTVGNTNRAFTFYQGTFARGQEFCFALDQLYLEITSS